MQLVKAKVEMKLYPEYQEWLLQADTSDNAEGPNCLRTAQFCSIAFKSLISKLVVYVGICMFSDPRALKIPHVVGSQVLETYPEFGSHP